VNAAVAELVVRGVHALRRSALWWGVGILFFAVLNTAFWPALEGTEALQSFEDMGEVLDAFGAQNLATPAGYLDGQVYALMLPLLLSGMAIAGASAITSGDEDAGRLELLHALPVSRRAVWLTRWAGALAVLAAVTAVVAVVMAACLPVFSLEGVGVAPVVAATFACGLLAAFHAAVAFAAGGLGASRALAVGVAILVLVAGYVVSFVLPLADALAGARGWSPWYWALGRQPVSDGVDPVRLLLLAGVTAALVAVGVRGVGRRDIRSA
jgi:ABC-2 type transport system permease protein